MNTKHFQLATRWLIYQGLKINENNLKKVSILSVQQLETILKQRGVSTKTI